MLRVLLPKEERQGEASVAVSPQATSPRFFSFPSFSRGWKRSQLLLPRLLAKQSQAPALAGDGPLSESCFAR